MATYRGHHSILISDTIEIMKDQIKRDMHDGAVNGTRITVSSTSGQIDPYTEEITYFTTHAFYNVSGHVGTINETDIMLGAAGRVRVGDSVVTYPFDAVSGFYYRNRITEVQVNTPGASGLYYVAAQKIVTLADTPIFLKVALTMDKNG